MSDWQPAASIENLQARATLNQRLRGFFLERGVMEVEVPLVAKATVTDPYIDSIPVVLGAEQGFLQTSPEFFMKRMLSAGSGPIYSLGKAFRQGESGSRHNPEFTMLEWYRPGFDDQRLMDEVTDLLQMLLPEQLAVSGDIERISYRALFLRHVSIDPHTATLATLQSLGQQHCDIDWQDERRDTWLDLLMTHVIEPNLGRGLTLVYDYPQSQAALARLARDEQGEWVAKRFEAYVGGMELANGYWELTDAAEQKRRFDSDWQQRERIGAPCLPQDEYLLAALQAGMPDTAGVALGVDRLLMLMTDSATIADVLSFPITRC